MTCAEKDGKRPAIKADLDFTLRDLPVESGMALTQNRKANRSEIITIREEILNDWRGVIEMEQGFIPKSAQEERKMDGPNSLNRP